MGEMASGGPSLELDDIFGGPMLYIPDTAEPDEDTDRMTFAENAMRGQSASSSASQ